MSINTKLNTLLAGQAAQNEAIAAIATAVNNGSGTAIDGLSTKIDALQKSVTDLNAEIGDEEPNEVAEKGTDAPVTNG